jgi:hypothetical protein
MSMLTPCTYKHKAHHQHLTPFSLHGRRLHKNYHWLGYGGTGDSACLGSACYSFKKSLTRAISNPVVCTSRQYQRGVEILISSERSASRQADEEHPWTSTALWRILLTHISNHVLCSPTPRSRYTLSIPFHQTSPS